MMIGNRLSVLLLFAIIGSIYCMDTFGPPITEEEKEAGSKIPDNDADIDPPYKASPMDDFPSDRLVISDERARWPNGRVPYAMDASFTNAEREIIGGAIKQFDDETCIQWVPKESSDNNYIYFRKGTGGTDSAGCWSYIGYSAFRGQQILNLQVPGCLDKSTIQHEMLHALGTFHEQSRGDRNDYVHINWENIYPSVWRQFFRIRFPNTNNTNSCNGAKTPEALDNCFDNIEAQLPGVPYDYHSIMHYGMTAFAIDSSINTITPLDESITKLGGGQMTMYDLLKINKAYGCVPTCPVSGPMAPFTQSSYFGNNTIGSVVTFTCIGDPSITFTSTCQEDLTWSKVSGVCPPTACPENIPSPPALSTASHGGGRNIGDVVVYICQVDNSISFTSTCQADFTWSDVKGTCPAAVDCCNTILIEADPEAYISTSETYRNFLGLFSTTGEVTTDTFTGFSYPVYRSNNMAIRDRYWFARVNQSRGEAVTWYMAPRHISLGRSSGYMFYGLGDISCPIEITTKRYQDQSNGAIFTEHRNISFACQPACSYSGPVVPMESTSNYAGINTVGAVVTFTCTSDNSVTLTSTCQEDMMWSEASGACPPTECPAEIPSPPDLIETSYDGSRNIGAIVVFTCPNDNSITLASVCQADFTWSAVNGTCLTTVCPETGPMQPADTKSSFDGSNSVGTIVTFTCDIDGKTTFKSQCMNNYEWSKVGCTCPEASEAVMGDNMLTTSGQCRYFTSSNWPSPYSPEQSTWSFISQVSECRRPKLSMVFSPMFNITGGNRCKFDKLSLRRSWKPSSEKKICNHFYPAGAPDDSSMRFNKGDNITMQFNAAVEGSGEGFKLTVCSTC